MTLQYFLFDTYAGMFILVLPIALIFSAVYGIIKFKHDKTTDNKMKIIKCFFVCYLVGLFELVLFWDLISKVFYWLIYHQDDGNKIVFFQLDLRTNLNFWLRMSGEVVGNVLAFIPFGILHCASSDNFSAFKTVLAGFICSFIIEVTQIVVSRCTDVNDLFLNTVGTIIGLLIFSIHKCLKRK